MHSILFTTEIKWGTIFDRFVNVLLLINLWVIIVIISAKKQDANKHCRLDLRVAAVQKHNPTWGWNRPQVDRPRLSHIRLDFTWQWHVTWVDFKRLHKFRSYDELAWIMQWLDFLYLFCLWVIKVLVLQLLMSVVVCFCAEAVRWNPRTSKSVYRKAMIGCRYDGDCVKRRQKSW